MKLPGEKGRYSYNSYLTSKFTMNGTTEEPLNLNGSISTNGGSLLVILSLPIKVSVNTGYAYVKIGNRLNRVIATDFVEASNTKVPVITGSLIINNIPKGQYTVDVLVEGSSEAATVTIETYKTISLTITEL